MLASCLLALASPQNIHVRWIDDEPKAVLTILREERAGKTPGEADWQALFKTEGYKRLKDREAGMNRAFTDGDFRKFIADPALVQRTDQLEKTLKEWDRIDITAMGRKCLAYLPKQANLSASVYPLIKPRTNSFVWDVEKSPAIMLYLNPDMSSERLRRTVVHEFHHIGYSSCCPNEAFKGWVKTQSKERQTAWMWVGAFGEGYAVLAAAGSPDADPMESFEPDVKAAWDHGITHLSEDMAALGKFFAGTVDGTLADKDVQALASQFYGIQGPWYTVGWVQATTIELVFGRKRLMDCYLDPRLLMPTYNEAAEKWAASGHVQLPTWRPELIAKLAGG